MKAAHPLRALRAEEERMLERTAKASSERVDVVQRARALLAVKAGQTYTRAAQEAGYKSGDSVSLLVERFNQQGLAALHIAGGRNARYGHLRRRRRECRTTIRLSRRLPTPCAAWGGGTKRSITFIARGL